MSSSEIAAAVGKYDDLESLAEALIERALETGAPDNVTVVVGRYRMAQVT